MRAAGRLCHRVSIALLFVLLAPVVLALFSFSTAGLRAALEFSYSAAAAISIPIVLGVSALMLRQIRELSPLLSTGALVAAVLVSGVFCEAMYHPAFDGLISTGGGDAADHIYYRWKFLNEDPNIYHGFTGFHSLTHLLETILQQNAFFSFRSAFYLIGTSALMLWILAVASAALEIEQRWRQSLVLLVALLLSYYPFRQILFPLFSYLQGEGFYPQLSAIVPLFLGWWLFTAERSLILRCLVLLLALILCRYAYGLHLADLTITCGVLVAVELASGAKKSWAAALTMAFTLSAAGWFYSLLWQLRERGGALLAPDLTFVCGGSLIISSCLLASAGSFSGRSARLFLFPGIFGFISSLVITCFLALELPANYYLYKYSFLSSVLLCAAAVAAGALLVSTFVHTRSLHLGLLLLGLGSGLYLMREGFQIYRPQFEERLAETTPPVILEPLADMAAWDTIDRTLEQGGSRFGGFIATPSWPLSGFMNAAFDYFHYREPRLHTTGRVRLKSGHCIFWNSSRDDMNRITEEGNSGLAERLRKLKGDPRTRTERYSVPWSSSQKQVSILCLDE